MKKLNLLLVFLFATANAFAASNVIKEKFSAKINSPGWLLTWVNRLNLIPSISVSKCGLFGYTILNCNTRMGRKAHENCI